MNGRLFTCAMALFALAGAKPASAAPSKRQLTAADIVAMQRIEEPSLLTIAYGGSPRLSHSRDGRHAAMITSQADLARNTVTYRILLYSAGEAAACLQRASHCAAAGRVLAEIESDSGAFQPPVRELRWQSDGEAILFMAPAPTRIPGVFGEALQVFRLPLSGGAPRQISHGERSVENYAYQAQAGRVVYTARLPDRRIDPASTSFIAGSMSVSQVVFPGRDDYFMPLYQRYAESADGVPVVVGRPHSSWFTNRTWISPDGRRAIARVSVTDQAVLREWRGRYRLLHAATQRQPEPDPDISEGSVTFTSRLILYDLVSGGERPLFDAPDGGFVAGGGDSVQLSWSPDGRRVAISNAFLPCDQVESCQQESAILDYEVATGSLRRIAALGTDIPIGADWRGDGTILLELTSGATRLLRETPDGWVEAAGPPVSASGIEFLIAQDANTPPDVVAREVGSGRQRRVSNLNPQFQDLTFGRVEPFAWTSDDGSSWNGGLLLPPGHRPGRRYPVVVQTYGFNPNSFVMDGFGGMSSAYAAQAMANRGMAVLLLPHDNAAHLRSGALRYRVGIRSALRELDRRGIVDPSRAGIIGFSGMGGVVRDMITFSDVPFAAGSINDSWSYTLLNYSTYLYGHALGGGPIGAETAVEAQPFGERLGVWVERDASLHADRISAALRLEDYGPGAVPTHWDMYVMLRRLHRPVEQVIFPRGAHQLRRPAERLESLGGNTDWFDFWLNGHEDPDPAKAAQYERWRAIRAGWQRQQAWEAAGNPVGSRPPSAPTQGNTN